MGGQNVYGTVLWWIAVTAIHDSNAMPRCGTAVTSGIERMQGIAPSPAKISNNDYISIPIRSQEGGEEAAPQQNPGSSLAPAPSGARAGGEGEGTGPLLPLAAAFSSADATSWCRSLLVTAGGNFAVCGLLMPNGAARGPAASCNRVHRCAFGLLRCTV